ncbi:MAG: hypothetical protein HRU70_09185 [Phycisphaeraceae bacterium]|nr:MAG: hypothetical protein HRU70_09185 [Phycisphaeraceae bacterium]
MGECKVGGAGREGGSGRAWPCARVVVGGVAIVVGAGLLGVAVGAVARAAGAQPEKVEPVEELTGDGDGLEWARRLSIDPEDPRLAGYKAAQKKRAEFERGLRKLRAESFRSEYAPKRREGIEKIKAHTDPTTFQSLIAVFGEEGEDVRRALLEHFRASRSDAGDRGLAWLAITDKDAGIRSAAREFLESRIGEEGKATAGMLEVVARAAAGGTSAHVERAATLAQGLNLYEVIPALIAAQAGGVGGGGVGGGGGGGGGGRRGDLAWVFIGEQQAYVADLTPLVSERAVAFDPQIGYVTSGALIRIHDAVVTVNHRPVIHRALMDLGSRLTGSDLSGLGQDRAAWAAWRDSAYAGAMAARKAEREAKSHGGVGAGAGTGGVSVPSGSGGSGGGGGG